MSIIFPLFKYAKSAKSTKKQPIRRELAEAEKKITFDQLLEMQRQAEEAHGLPTGMLNMIVYEETRGDPSRVSSAGALTVYQILPSVMAKEGYNISDYTDVAQVTNAAAAMLAKMRTKILAYPNSKNYKGLGGDRGWELAALEYIAGRGNITKWLNAGAPMTGHGNLGPQSIARLKTMAREMQAGLNPAKVAEMRKQWEKATGQIKTV